MVHGCDTLSIQAHMAVVGFVLTLLLACAALVS